MSTVAQRVTFLPAGAFQADLRARVEAYFHETAVRRAAAGGSA
jgi:hypothetical protein